MYGHIRRMPGLIWPPFLAPPGSLAPAVGSPWGRVMLHCGTSALHLVVTACLGPDLEDSEAMTNTRGPNVRGILWH